MISFLWEQGRLRQRLIFAGLFAALAVMGWLVFGGKKDADLAAAVSPSSQQIIARGRIEPAERVIALHGAVEGTVIRKLLVNQGDQVAAGQVLAVLDGYDIRQAEIAVAAANLRLAELSRKQTVAGAKRSELAAQRSAVQAKNAQRERLNKDWARRHALYEHGFATEQSLEGVKADLAQAESEVAQASHTLYALTETRDVDDAVAAARIEVERANLERVRAEAEHMLVRAPFAGTILSIQARAGEVIASDGLLRMAPLDHIIVVAEVNEGDIRNLRTGMGAMIEGLMLPSAIHGKVTLLSNEVFRQKRPSSDVLIGRDARIVEVEVTPDQPLPAVLGGEVLVRLLIEPPTGS